MKYSDSDLPPIPKDFLFVQEKEIWPSQPVFHDLLRQVLRQKKNIEDLMKLNPHF